MGCLRQRYIKGIAVAQQKQPTKKEHQTEEEQKATQGTQKLRNQKEY
jgi:hypothetical protein